PMPEVPANSREHPENGRNIRTTAAWDSCQLVVASERPCLHRQLATNNWPLLLDLLDLPVFQFQRGGSTENGRDDPDHALVGDELVDFAFEVDERAVGDLDPLALL